MIWAFMVAYLFGTLVLAAGLLVLHWALRVGER